MKHASRKFKMHQLVKWEGAPYSTMQGKFGMVVKFHGQRHTMESFNTYTVLWFLPGGSTVRVPYLYEHEISAIC